MYFPKPYFLNLIEEVWKSFFFFFERVESVSGTFQLYKARPHI